MKVKDVKERIRAYRRGCRWSINRLAMEAGLRSTTIAGIDADHWNPTTKTLEALESIIPDDFDASAVCEEPLASKKKKNSVGKSPQKNTAPAGA